MQFLKRLAIVSVAATVFLAALSLPVAAQQATMTDAHIQRIQANCEQAIQTLTQLHASDALLRVNRGQLYDLISNKLMARFNSRLALNRLDGGKLITSAAAFDKTLGEFRSNYQQYEEQLSQVLRIDCKKQPVAFYDGVTAARNRRTAVHANVGTLQRYIDEYSHEFDAFRSKYQSDAKADAS